MRVCILGNSHVAALYDAWYEEKDLLPCPVDFFSTPSPSNYVKDGRLFASDPDTVSTNVADAINDGLRLSEYDCILISAGGYWVYRNEHKGHPLFEIRLANWEAHEHRPPRIVSSAVMDATIVSILLRSPVIQICESIAKCYQGKMLVQPWPLPGPGVYEDREWNFAKLYGESAPRVTAEFFMRQYEAMRKLLRQFREDILLLPYPEPVDPGSGQTPGHFASADPWHMNQEYGRLVLQQLRDAT
jgi:hypothetical protein